MQLKNLPRSIVKGIPIYPLMAHPKFITKSTTIGDIKALNKRRLNNAENEAEKINVIKRDSNSKIGSLVRVYFKTSRDATPSTFSGFLLSIQKNISEPTFLVRGVIDGVGVEQKFCLLSPLLTKIEIIKSPIQKDTGSKLYWWRERPDSIPSFFK